MIVFADINDVSLMELGPELFNALGRLFPDGVKPGGRGPMLRIKTRVDDPRLAAAQQLLADRGFQPRRPDLVAGPKQYPLGFFKAYDRSDWDDAPFLEVCARPEAWIAHFKQTDSGQICFQTESPADVAA